MSLFDFSRPPKDNSRGLHGPPGPHPDGFEGVGFLAQWDLWAEQLLEMNIKWVKILDTGDGSSLELARRLISIGIMPVVRFYRQEPNPHPIYADREVATAAKYVGMGCVYFETNNEPDLDKEWEGGKRPENWLDIVVRNFIAEADMIHSVGGFLLFPAFGVGGRDNPFQMIVDYGREDLFEGKICLAIHNYCLARPLDYPNDDVTLYGIPITEEEWKQEASDKKDGNGAMWAWEMGYETVNKHRKNMANPNANIMQDSTCFRAFEYFDALVNEVCDHSIPIFTTEGGYNVGQRAGTTFGDDPRWPKPSPQKTAELTLEMFNYPMPDYYFANMVWLIANNEMGYYAEQGFEHQGPWFSWNFLDWHNCEGQLPVVQMLKNNPGEIRANGPLPEHWGKQNVVEVKMANEFDYKIAEFLSNDEIINTAEDYNVTIDLATFDSNGVFEVIGIHHLEPQENKGRHHVFIEVLDEKGHRLQGAKVNWKWEGMRPEETPHPIIIDKPDNETSNLPLQSNFPSVSIWVDGLNSDIVNGLSSRHPDEGEGNTYGHHSFLVVFQVLKMDEPIDPSEPPENNDWEDRYWELVKELKELVNKYS